MYMCVGDNIIMSGRVCMCVNVTEGEGVIIIMKFKKC